MEIHFGPIRGHDRRSKAKESFPIGSAGISGRGYANTWAKTSRERAVTRAKKESGEHWKCERRSCRHENEWTDRLGHRPTAETKPVAPGRNNVTALGCHYNLNVCSKKLLGSKNGLFARKLWAPWAFALKTSVIPGAQCCLASTEVHCKGLAQLLYII